MQKESPHNGEGKRLPIKNGKAHHSSNGIDKIGKPALPRSAKKPVNDLPPREQLRELLQTIKAVRAGDFSVRMPLASEGLIAEIGEVLNDIIELNDNMANEFIRVRGTVGLEGRMMDRVAMGTVKGSWSTSVNQVNMLIGDLVQPTTEIARVITSVASGDLSQKMSLEIDGRSLNKTVP